MRKPHLGLLLALAALAISAAAFAAAPKPPAPPAAAPAAAPAAPAAAHDMRVTVTTDADDDDAMLADDDVAGPGDDLLADDDGPGERHVMVRRVMRGGDGGDGGDMGPGMHGWMGMRHGGPDEPGARFGMMLGRLDLTDAQRDKMRDIHEKQMRRDIQARADMEIGRLDLRKLMSAEKPDAGAINAQIDKLARMRAEQSKSRVASFLEARALLTPEQLKKARELMQQGPGMGMGRGPGMGHMHVHVERDTVGQGPK